MTPIFIGNCISLVAAVFTALSSWSKDTWHIYFYQVVQCLLLALSSVFFSSYTGIVTLLACALRNYLAAREKLNQKAMLVCLFLVVVPGLLLNNRGALGLIIILANILYTLGMYLAKGEFLIKLNICINLSLWMTYSFFIRDISTLVSDGISLAVTLAAIIRYFTAQNKG